LSEKKEWKYDLLFGLIGAALAVAGGYGGQWLPRLWDPNGPRIKFAAVSVEAERVLDPDTANLLNGAVHLRQIALEDFPIWTGQPSVSTFHPYCGQWLIDSTIFPGCVPVLTRWAVYQKQIALAQLAQIRSAPPGDSATWKEDEIRQRADLFPHLEAAFDSLQKDGKVEVSALLVNDGNGDDVVTPDAKLCADVCKDNSTFWPLTSSGGYQTLKAHSSLPVSYEPEGKAASDLATVIKKGTSAKVQVCATVASGGVTCSAGGIAIK